MSDMDQYGHRGGGHRAQTASEQPSVQASIPPLPGGHRDFFHQRSCFLFGIRSPFYEKLLGIISQVSAKAHHQAFPKHPLRFFLFFFFPKLIGLMSFLLVVLA